MYHKAAEGGHAQAQWKLGSVFHYQREAGYVVDKEKALFWYKKAAEGGHSHAQWELGRAYKDGMPELEMDIEKAEAVATAMPCLVWEVGPEGTPSG